MQLYMQISVSVVLGVAGLAVLIFGMRWFRSGSISKRLNQYVAAPLDNSRNRANAFRIPPRVITGSFLIERYYQPFAELVVFLVD